MIDQSANTSTIHNRILFSVHRNYHCILYMIHSPNAINILLILSCLLKNNTWISPYKKVHLTIGDHFFQCQKPTKSCGILFICTSAQKSCKDFLGFGGWRISYIVISKLGFLLKAMTFQIYNESILLGCHMVHTTLYAFQTDSSTYETGYLNKQIEFPPKYSNNNCNTQCSQNMLLSISKALY